MKKKDGWKPMKKGKILCSPKCGAGCTKAEHDRLYKVGQRLAAGLGSGWKIRMHENLQWFVEVISPCRRIRVGPDFNYNNKVNGQPKLLGYYANICEPDDLGILYSAHQETPLEAVRTVILNAQEDLKNRGAAIVDPAMLQYLSKCSGEKIAIVEDTHFQFMGHRILIEVEIGPGDHEEQKVSAALAKWRQFITSKVPDSAERRS